MSPSQKGNPWYGNSNEGHADSVLGHEKSYHS